MRFFKETAAHQDVRDSEHRAPTAAFLTAALNQQTSLSLGGPSACRLVAEQCSNCHLGV